MRWPGTPGRINPVANDFRPDYSDQAAPFGEVADGEGLDGKFRAVDSVLVSDGHACFVLLGAEGFAGGRGEAGGGVLVRAFASLAAS